MNLIYHGIKELIHSLFSCWRFLLFYLFCFGKKKIMLDIKIPIGLMFSIFGLILLVYGFITRDDTAMYQKSFSHNVNLWMGALMVVFGGVMLLLSRKKA